MTEQNEFAAWRINLVAGNNPPSKKIVLGRLLWQMVWLFAFRPFPRRLGNDWRAFLLRSFGAKIGKAVLLSPSMKVMQPWELEIGPYTAIGENVEFYNFKKIKVGGMALVSQRAYLCTGTHDYTHPHNPLVTAPITIEDEAWVAAGAFVAPGVTIGRGAVVGAHAVVVKSMPPWMFCAGNPCRPIKAREIKNLPVKDAPRS